MVFLKRTGLVGCLLLLLAGCRKPTGANWDVDVVLPIVNGSLSTMNFAGDTLFEADNTGLIHFKYNRQVAAIMLDSLLRSPDTTVVKEFPDPAQPLPTLTLTAGAALASSSEELYLDISNGIQLTRVDVRTGMLSVKFSNTVDQPLDLTYTLPGAIKNGSAFTIFETIPPGINSLVKNYDLSGYALSLVGVKGKKYNTIRQTYVVALPPNTSSVVVPAGKGVKIELSYPEMIPQYVEGYFGQQIIDLKSDTAKLDLFTDFMPTNFLLSDATMLFKIVNEFGADFHASIWDLQSINSAHNKVVTLQTNALSSINIDRAKHPLGYPEPTIEPILFTSANSNITQFISNLPDKITYQGSVQMNPPPIGNTGFRDFAYYKTGLKILADIDIPLRFRADDFRLESESAVDFSNVEQLDRVNAGQFVIKAANGFPFATTIQVYLLDQNKKTIDSLFVGANVVDHGPLDANYEVISVAETNLSVPIGPEKITSLKVTRWIKTVTVFVLPPYPPDIGIYDRYKIDLKIMAELNYNVGIRSRD